jgi:hypothetical protein
MFNQLCFSIIPFPSNHVSFVNPNIITLGIVVNSKKKGGHVLWFSELGLFKEEVGASAFFIGAGGRERRKEEYRQPLTCTLNTSEATLF